MDWMIISRGAILAITLAAVFATSVLTLLKIIRSAGFFAGRSRVLVAVSLSILFLVALFYFLVGPADVYPAAGSDSGVRTADQSLLPGIALGVAAALVLSQVLVLANRTSPDEKPEFRVNKPESPVKPKPGRPKKKEPENPPAPQKPGGKRKNETKATSPAEGAATT